MSYLWSQFYSSMHSLSILLSSLSIHVASPTSILSTTHTVTHSLNHSSACQSGVSHFINGYTHSSRKLVVHPLK